MNYKCHTKRGCVLEAPYWEEHFKNFAGNCSHANGVPQDLLVQKEEQRDPSAN